jgi:hypothetical protein
MSDGPGRRDGSAPTFRQLVDWVEGRLTRRDATEVGAAVDRGGPDVERTVAWIRDFIELGRRHPLPTPPPIVRQRLRQSFGRHNGQLPPLRRETADLMFDSRDDAVVAGVRGGPSLDDGYRLAFASESVGVLVDVLPASDRTVDLEGQVLTPDGSAPVWEVTVHHPRGRRTDSGGDRNGSFSIDDVPLDVISLRLSNGEVELDIPHPLGRPSP